jgi:hypothetical protein
MKVYNKLESNGLEMTSVLMQFVIFSNGTQALFGRDASIHAKET